MKEKQGLSLEDSGYGLVLRHKGLENSYLGLFLFFMGLSVVLPVLFAIFLWDISEILVIIAVLFGLTEVCAWGIGLLLIRDARLLKLDRTAAKVILSCGIPIISILGRDKVYAFRDIKGLVLLEKPIRGGKAWFLFIDKKEGKPVKILGSLEDDENTRGIIRTVNDMINKF